MTYRFDITIYSGFAFIVTTFHIFKLIIGYQVDHRRPFKPAPNGRRPPETGGYFELLQRVVKSVV